MVMQEKKFLNQQDKNLSKRVMSSKTELITCTNHTTTTRVTSEGLICMPKCKKVLNCDELDKASHPWGSTNNLAAPCYRKESAYLLSHRLLII